MAKKKEVIKRSIELTGLGETLELSKVTGVKLNGRRMIHLDELPDGTWRLTYNTEHITNLTQLQALTIIREG